MKRNLLLLFCLFGVWAVLRADDISEDTMRSAAVRIDGRTSIGGRIIHGTQRISPVAENANGNAKLTVDRFAADGWSVGNPQFDSRKEEDGWHGFVLNEGTKKAEANLLILNDDHVVIHGGALTANETWAAGKVHVVRNWVRIPEGRTLTVATNAVVKFCENTGIQVDGTIKANKAVFTSIADDTAGGDTDMNGETVDVGYGLYDIMGNGTKTLTDCDIRCAASLPVDTTWTAGRVIHVMGVLTVPSGVTLTIQSGAVVKFATGAELKADGGSISANGVLFTHLADDSAEAGGDTNDDGDATSPVNDAYKLTGFTPSADCELRYMTLTFEGGTISSTKILQGNRVHKVTGNIMIASGGKLIVQPGAVVKMEAGLSINVNSGGTLEALGNRAQPIVFTSIKDDAHGGDTNGDGNKTVAEGGDWKYISVQGQAYLQFCSLMYGAPSNETGIIETSGSGILEMDCCTVAHARYDGVWNWGGSITVRNSIIMDVGLGAAPYRGNRNEYTNCIFYANNYIAMYWSHWSGNPVFNNCIFKNMGENWLDINGYSNAYNVVGFNHCVFHNDSGYSVQSCVKDGIDGNIYSDPLFNDPDNGDFTLQAGSPCIDAGDGSVSNLPQYDYYGQPRCWSDGHVTPTGIADVNGNYPDIGLFDMCGDMDSDLDVVMNWAEGPATAMAGDTVTIRWQAANIGTVTGMGPRRDNIYLVSKDERLGNRRVFIATATVSNRMVPGGIVTYMFDKARIPSVTPGKWGFAVFANEERDWFEGRNIENNYLVSAGDCEITLPIIVCAAQGSALTVNSGENAGFQLTDVPAEGAMLVVRGGNGINVTGQFGSLPETISQGWKAVDLGNGTVLLTIPPATVASDVFILLENTGNEDVQVGIDTLTGSFALFDNGVTTASNSGTVTIPLYGIGLTEDMEVYLKQGAARIDASSLTVAENGTFYATFDVTGAAAGSWTLFATNENGSGSLDALTLTQALKGPQWWCKLELPSAIRRGRTIVGTFIYGNRGDADMDAPYVKIEGETGVNVRLSENDAWGKTIEFLALSATYPVSRLRAGEERRQTFEFIQLNDNTKVNIKYEYVAQNSTETFPWETNGKLMRPDWASDEDWNAILNRLKSAVGSTWGSIFDRMRANADYLAMLGRPTNDLGILWQLDVREAFAMDNAVSTQAVVKDMVRNGRGLSILISRRFGTSLKTRAWTGAFGRGWTMSYETKAVLRDDGETLDFEIPTGDIYSFSTIAGAWCSTVAGDKTQLEDTADAYILRFPNGFSARFSKTNGRMVATRDCNGNGLDFSYNGNRLNQITHTDGQWVKFTYSGEYVSKIVDDLGHSVTYTYSGNRLIAVISVDGLMTQYRYDNVANALKTIINPDGTTRDYTFDETGRIATISHNGNLQTIIINRGIFGSYSIIDANDAVTDTAVGASGEVLYTIDALGNKTIYGYDNDVAVVTSVKTAMGRTVYWGYDRDFFNVTQGIASDGTATHFAYSEDFGHLESYTDANGHTVTYSYDEKGQNIGTTLADGKESTLEYNEKGDVVSTTDRGCMKTMTEYDAEGRVVRRKDADDRTQEYTYDVSGNVIKLKDSLMGDTTMSYTAQEWLKSITYADGRGFSYEYDDAGRMVKQTYSDGFAQCYEYDALGRIVRMTEKNGKLLVSNAYDEKTGFLLTRTFGNGTSVHYTYDLNGNTLSITHKDKNGNNLETFQYTYNADGQRTQVESSEGVETYTYDLAGQLTAVTYPDGTTETFAYDAVGNRVSANGEDYTTNELNQYLMAGDATFTYDDNGNLISRTDANGKTNYEYDARSRLVHVVRPDGTTWSCQYDALGNRTQVNDNGQIRKQLYTPDNLSSLAAEYNASGKLIRRYILLDNELIADVDASGNYRYYHSDVLGSTRLVTNGVGSIVSRQSYNIFGGSLMTSGEPIRFGFVGTYGVEADTTGLLFMRNRYHNATLGRFIQMDPIGFSAGDINWYRYCGNTPSIAIDLDGLQESVTCETMYKGNEKKKNKCELICEGGGGSADSEKSIGYGSTPFRKTPCPPKQQSRDNSTKQQSRDNSTPKSQKR